MKLLSNLFILFRLLITSFLLVSFIILVTLTQTLSLLIRPFAPHAFRKYNSKCGDVYWKFLVFCAETLHGVKVVFSGDSVPPDENAILISNHQSYVDAIILLYFVRKYNRLGDLKWYMKDVLKFLPFVGWGMWCMDNIFLKRNWTEDQRVVDQSFSRVLKFKSPIWLMVFAEGTRMTPSKLKANQEFARSQGINPTDQVMIPRTRGFLAALAGLGSHFNAVYDLTLGYPDRFPAFLDLAMGKIKTVHLHVKRYPVADLPKTEAEQKVWLVELFQRKDRLLKQFHASGSFESP
jgi:1-acyl-sn-glycerol-3-phosphate acyltransferase